MSEDAPCGRCHYCNRVLIEAWKRGKRSKTRDHVVPKWLGGTQTVPCCLHCNRLKADLHFIDWKGVMVTYPDWWKRFSTHAELRDQIMEDRRLRQVYSFQPYWPLDVRIPLPPLCRGLPRSQPHRMRSA